VNSQRSRCNSAAHCACWFSRRQHSRIICHCRRSFQFKQCADPSTPAAAPVCRREAAAQTAPPLFPAVARWHRRTARPLTIDPQLRPQRRRAPAACGHQACLRSPFAALRRSGTLRVTVVFDGIRISATEVEGRTNRAEQPSQEFTFLL
jgi:hypothetical protein